MTAKILIALITLVLGALILAVGILVSKPEIEGPKQACVPIYYSGLECCK